AGALTDLVHWRAAFVVPGLVSLVTGIALFGCWRAGLVSDRHADVEPRPAPHRGAVVRAFLVLSITMLATGLIYQSMAAALPKMFAERAAGLTGGTTVGAGALVSVVYLLATGTQLLGGHLADRRSMRNLYLLAFLFQAPLMLVAALLSGLPMFAVLTATVLLSTVAIPVENSLLSHYSPERWRGTAFGAKFVLALGVSALGVPLVAFIHRTTGAFTWYFVLLAAFAAVVAGGAMLLPQDRPAGAPAPRPGPFA
ncbi:MAG TPA: MFS transporter, partial [Anaeromyxobacteraceae bacterium]|nr:MFS transporter [Anaeromyxobacteraceae bacterium]